MKKAFIVFTARTGIDRAFKGCERLVSDT